MTTLQANPDASASMGEAISVRLTSLAAFSDEDRALTRLYLSPAHRKAADLVIRSMRDAGMSARIDSVGNVVGRYEADRSQARTLIVGSHIDTVRRAGSYDGNLGVVTAIETIDRLHREGRRQLPSRSWHLATRRASAFPRRSGGRARWPASSTRPSSMSAMRLEFRAGRRSLHSGVTRAASQRRRGHLKTLSVTSKYISSRAQCLNLRTGRSEWSRRSAARAAARSGSSAKSAHAGATPMPLRRDALAAAAVMISAIESRARAGPELVATIGRLEIAHPAANTVPGAVSFALDVRAPDDAVRKAAVRDITERIAEIAQSRGVQAQVDMRYDAPSSLSDPALSDGLAASIEQLGLTVRRLLGHDAMAFRVRIPFGTLFVRCRGGVSHNPTEYVAPEDIDIGARVLLDFIERLAPASNKEV